MSNTNPTGTDLRREALAEVEKCVCADRQNTYGDAEENFANIATLVNVFLGKKLKEPLDRLDVAMLSICIKMARCSNTPRHLDHWIDIAGYAACGAGIIKREKL
jgi:hypothetical protein